MKKIFYILLFITSLAYGQRGQGGANKQTRTWLGTLGTHPSATSSYAIGCYIQRQVFDGMWAFKDEQWILAQDIQANGNIGIMAGTTATAVNSPTWTAYTGYAFNGTTNYVNTGWNGTMGSQFALNNCSGGEYLVSPGNGAGYDFGAEVTSPSIIRTVVGVGYSNVPDAEGTVNSTVGTVGSVLPATSGWGSWVGKGMFTVSRTTSSNVSLTNNGQGAANTNVTDNSAASFSSQPIYLGCRNRGGVAQVFCSPTIAMFYVGAGIKGGSLVAATDYADFQQCATKMGFNQ